MAFRRLFKTPVDVVSDIISAPSRSRSQQKGKRADQIRRDVQFLRGIKKSARSSNSAPVFDYSASKLQDPLSPARRQTRVKNYKRNVRNKSRRFFRSK